MSAYDPDGDKDEFLADLNQTLESEISRDVSAALQGWSTYKLLHPVELRKGHELPTTAKEFNCMVSVVLTALDARATSHDGETMVKGLTPQSWTRLTLATINSYFDRLTTLLDSRMHQVPTVTGQPPLKEEDQAQISAATHERLVLQGIETMRLDPEAMREIKEAVKVEIYANLNAEALQNADDWRALYKHKFVEAMHDAFKAQYLGIHPNKGKARANPPITNSQVVREAQPRIQEEVRIQVEARVANIHQEIKASIANQEPFWGEGPLRQAIAQEIRTKTQHDVQQELEAEIQALRTNSASELDAFKLQLQWKQDKAHKALHAEAKAEYEAAKQLFANNLEADIQEFKTVIGKNVKEWKDGFRTSRNLSALKREARRFGFSIVDGRDVSAEPADAPSPAQTPFLTPDNLPNALPDPNVTPMPVRVKCTRTEEPAVYPPLKESLFLPVSSPTPTPHAVAVPLPMDEDLDYALEVRTYHLYATGPSIYASIHASSSDTNHDSLVHNPSALPQGSVLDAQSERKPTDPSPSPLIPAPTKLEEPPAPPCRTDDNLAAILAAINATILGLEGRLTERLNAQDARISALTVLTNPSPPHPVKEKRAKGDAPVAATRPHNTPSTPPGTSETWVPAPPSMTLPPVTAWKKSGPPVPRQQLRQQPRPNPQLSGKPSSPPPEKHVRLNVDAHGKPTPATSMPPSWANIVTKKATAQQQQNSAKARAVTQGTYRSGTGKAQPETVNRCKATGNTKATVIRHHSLDDIAFEMTIQKMTPAAIIAETHTEVDRLSGGKVTLLSSCWSLNPNRTIHNFVYTFKGQVPFKTLYPLRDILVKLLMTGHLVPNDGWTFAQIRDTTTSGTDGTVFTGTQLEQELRCNPAFEEAIFCITPHWQGSMHKVSTNPRGTVKFVYVDEGGRITAQAKRDGVFLFNEKTQFVPTGDIATIILCS
ncbi:hypothetical protein EDB86DRAFT_3088979 [Lactarius hatsudake]|nr:hypothetical protein EDB86DRAFT_3088979 [Lactarius hatsudake]